jgi:hypothetical protein
MENERLHQSIINSEARLMKLSNLLRQAYTEDHEADRSVKTTLLGLQTQNQGLRHALGLRVEAGIEPDADPRIFASSTDPEEVKEQLWMQ